MQRLFLFLLFIPISVFAQKGGYEIDGTVTGFAEGTVVKITNGNDNSDMASGKIANGKFVIKGTVDEPTLCKLAIGSEAPQYVYVENKKMTVTGSKTNIQHLKVTGSPVHNDFMKFQEVFNPLITSLNTTVNAINRATQRPQYDALMKVYDSTKDVVQKRIDEFITSKPKSIVSPFLLLVTADMYDDPLLLEKDTIRWILLSKTIPSAKIYTLTFNITKLVRSARQLLTLLSLTQQVRL